MYFFFFFVCVGVVRCDYKANIRSAITSDHIQGYIMMKLLGDTAHNDILSKIKLLMAEFSPPDNRLRDLLWLADNSGLECHQPEISWRDERFNFAKKRMAELEKDPQLLTRVIAIDEKTLINGKLEFIAGTTTNGLVNHMFLRDRKAHTEDILEFLSHISGLEERGVFRNPIILWDNINVHKNDRVKKFIGEKGWTVWYNPRDSADMHPLDYSDFKTLKSEYLKHITDLTVENHIAGVMEAISKVVLKGVSKLPLVWAALIESEGLSAAVP